jgi:hypothetical protein
MQGGKGHVRARLEMSKRQMTADALDGTWASWVVFVPLKHTNTGDVRLSAICVVCEQKWKGVPTRYELVSSGLTSGSSKTQSFRQDLKQQSNIQTHAVDNKAGVDRPHDACISESKIVCSAPQPRSYIAEEHGDKGAFR